VEGKFVESVVVSVRRGVEELVRGGTDV
jgi:hypothetical protein